MQRAITLQHRGMTLRGMEHVPEQASTQPVPAAILFHGFTGTKVEPHRLFVKLSRALEARGIAAFRYDFLGSGESDGNFEDMTVSGEVEEAHAILDSVRQDPRVNPDKVSLVGLSMGGLVASLVAGDRPADVHKLVLLAPAGTMLDLVLGMVQSAQVDVERTEVFDHGGNLVGRAFVEDLLKLSVYPRAANYTGPVLILHGSRDETVPLEASHRYVRESYGDRAQLHLIEGADHTFNKLEWEQEVIHRVCDFLS
jgi:pimeloyl-ACP methyl ester carboxylesterase